MATVVRPASPAARVIPPPAPNFVAGQDGWRKTEESAAVPGLRPGNLEALLEEPNDIARTRRAEELAARLAPAFALQYGP